MQLQSITPLDERAIVEAAERLLAGLPIRGRLRPATQVCAMLAYARTSKSIQTSLPDQHDAITKMSWRVSVPITQRREDAGKSGMRNDRVAYRRLLEDLASGEYSHLGLFKADRLARDSVELIGTVKACWALGITVLDSTIGEITPHNLHLLALLAEMEIRQLSERTSNGLEHKAKDHKLGRAPLGYVHGSGKGEWLPDGELSLILQKLGERFASGESIASLVEWINSVHGAHHDAAHIRRILRNEFYAGWIVNRKQSRSILNGGKVYARPKEDWTAPFRHDYPLWNDELWEKIQARLTLSRNVGQVRATTARYALQGILWCKQCDKRMHGNSRGGDGKYYVCPYCHLQRGLKKVEAATRLALENIVLDSQKVAQVQAGMACQRAELERELDELAVQQRNLRARRKRAYERLDTGIIDVEQYGEQVAEIDEARAALNVQEEQLQRRLADLPTNEKMVAEIAAQRAEWLYWPDKIPSYDVERQQQVYRECCARVVLDRGTNSLTVHYTPHLAPLARRASYTVSLAKVVEGG